VTVHPAPGPIARAVWLLVDTFRSPVVFEGTAELCDSTHPGIFGWAPAGRPTPQALTHVDVDGKFHNRSHAVTTLIGVRDAKVRGQTLVADGFKELALEPGGPREETSFELDAADGSPVDAEAGDTVTLTLRLTRGGLSLKLTLS
jgi:hypothetical protein